MTIPLAKVRSRLCALAAVACLLTTGSVSASVDSMRLRGGVITGRVTDASTDAPVSAVTLQLFDSNGIVATSAASAADGTYRFAGLPTGTYYVRTALSSGVDYIDQIYSGITCVDCSVTETGTPIEVTNYCTTPDIDFALTKATADSYEPDDAAAEAKLLVAGSPQLHTFHVDGDHDWVRFPAVAGRTYTVFTSGLTANLDTVLFLYAADGSTELAVNDNNSGEASRVVYTAIVTGDLFAKVDRSSIAGSLGGYALTLTERVPEPHNTADFDGDRRSDAAVYRPSDGRWLWRDSQSDFQTLTSNVLWGSLGDVPRTGDFDGDGKTDAIVYRPSTGQWFYLYSSSGYFTASYGYVQWGFLNDIPLTADFDGDGKTDIVAYRPSTGQWFILFSGKGYDAAQYGYFQWGVLGDVPRTADFDGDHKTDIAVFRPLTGQWFILFSGKGYDAAQYGDFQWGTLGDQPLNGDFDGDGVADIAVYRPWTGQWFVLYSSNGYNQSQFGYFEWGASGDQPLTTDFDGDGRADVTVYRPDTGQWFIRYSSRGYDSALFGYTQLGVAGDVPLPPQ